MSNYAPVGIFDILDIDTILAIQAKALSFIMEGKTLMEWDGEGTSAVKQFSLDPYIVLQECKYSLKQLDPSTYGQFIRVVKPFHL